MSIAKTSTWPSTGISHVGPGYSGPADVELDGRDRMLMPGLINIHSHPTSEPLRKGITDEITGFYHSSLYEFLTIFNNDFDGFSASVRVAMGELLKSGVTTVVDISAPFDGWLDILAESGIRACVAPAFRDARWYTDNGHALKYEWNEAAGRAGFDKAQRVIDLANQHPSGRLMGMVCPSQIDTCSADLLRVAYDLAEERNLPWQTHAAQSVTEFQEMIRRHGRTPVQWMKDIGVLGPHTIIGHGIFLDHHPWVHWSTRQDLDLLADNSVTVAHCPTVFLRRGITLQTFGGYLGLHHFYLGRTTIGLIWLITFGGFGLGWAYDFVRLNELVHEANLQAGSVNPTRTGDACPAVT